MALKTEILIENVKKYPVLYDTSHCDYKNIRFKNQIWDNIAEIIGGSDGDTLKKQWKNLRDAYSKHLRSCKSTGQTTKLIDRYRTWPWAKLMSFLRPHLEFAETQIMQRNAEEAVCCQSIIKRNTADTGYSPSINMSPINTAQSDPNDLSQSQQNDIPQYAHIRRKRTSDQTQSQIDKVINFMSQNTEKDDDTDLLFKSYSKKLKKMTMHRQALVKFEIAKVMLKAELEEADEQSKSDAGQYEEISDTKDSVYIVSSSPPVFEDVDPFSSPSPS